MDLLYGLSVIDECVGRMIAEMGKPKCLKKSLLQCHFIHHKYDMNYAGTEAGSPR
jgi:hypothetical protein